MGNPKRKLEHGTWIGLPKKNIVSTTFNDVKVNVFTLQSEYDYYRGILYNKPEKKIIIDAIAEKLNSQ